MFKVVSTAGDTFLGGEDFDLRIIDWLVQGFNDEHDIDLRQDRMALQRLKDAAEKAKCELSGVEQTEVNLPFIISNARNEALHLQRTLTRTQLEELTRDLVNRTVETCDQTLQEASMGKGDIDDVLLVGGMTRMPLVQRKIEAIFGAKIAKDVNPDEIVAVGAAIQCGILGGEIDDIVLLDVTPHSLGVRVKGDRMAKVIPRNTTIPTSETKRFATTEDDQTFVEVQVYQGESERVQDNTPLGRFTLGNLPARARGEVRVEVNFLVNADGVLEVSAQELSSGKQASVRIAASSGLSKDEVRQLRQRHSTTA